MPEPVRIDLSLDLRGEICPHPVMLTLDQLAKMTSGQVLQVVADCPAALVNVPLEVVRHGHRLIGEPLQRGAEILMLVEVAGRPDDAPRRAAAAPRRPALGVRRARTA